MSTPKRPWQEELEIIDRTMRKISGIADPDKLVAAYWEGIGSLVPGDNYVAISRRNVPPPGYLITRSSRFTEQVNPWTQRDRLPRLTGGVLGEIAYANKPVIIDDLPARLGPDDPARFHLEGFEKLIALPQYDGGEGLNVLCSLVPPGSDGDMSFIPMLHWHSGLFGRGTQNLVLRNQLADALGKLDRELQVVGEIQRSLLPRELPAIPGFEVAASYVTSARAGGDYYDFFPLANGGWGVFIADVSGHGTPAAVLMAITHAIAHSQPGSHTPPASLLAYLNRQLTQSYTGGGTFVTAFYAVLDPFRRTLTYSAAGHNPPRLARRGEGGAASVFSLNEAGSLPLGIDADQAYAQASRTIERGDLLLLYTDGITEARGIHAASRPRPLELFGVERLDRILVGDAAAGGAAGVIERVSAEVAAFTEGSPPTDDQTLIAIRCK